MSHCVAGDQLRAEKGETKPVERALVAHNLLLRADNWPDGLGLQDAAPILGDPMLTHPGGDALADYVPKAVALVKDRGVKIPFIPGDTIGLTLGLEVTTDILGQPVIGAPDLGAIELR